VSDLIVIPSARLVAPELQADFGTIPPALIPLDGRMAMQYILDAAPQSSRAVVAGHERFDLLRDAAAHVGGISVIDVGPTSSLGQTVLGAVAAEDLGAASRLVVNFADTLVPGLPVIGDAIAYRLEADAYRWTAFHTDAEGGIARVVEKDTDKGGDPLPVFVGAFAFADPGAFRDELAAAVSAAVDGVEPLYVAVRRYVAARGAAALYAAEVWHDFGHVDTYYRTRQRLFIDRRVFNDIEVDARSGVLRKRSTDAAKLRREVAWYQRLPPPVAMLAPRVLDQGGTADEAFVDLEYYGYPPLADAYLYGDWDLGGWDLALASVEDASRRLHGERLLLSDAECTRALRAMYVTKTEERLASVLSDPAFEPLRGERLVLDGRPGLGLDGALAVLPELGDALGLCAPRPMGIIHGDLCLSNILYDRRNGIVRLIDPRGAFGELELHGDPLYDHAKLAHSIEGDYDHLLRGLFTLELAPGAARLDVRLTATQRAVKALHRRRADRLLGADAPRAALIQALLFLTMAPLHPDRPASQLAFVVRGLGIVSALARRAAGARAPQSVAA
jgi:hypothetical protein